MSDSALYGRPPLNSHDADLMMGLFGSTKPPPLVKIPADAPHSQAKGMIIGLCFAIVLVVTVTSARLLVRAFRQGQIFGWDDAVIIPGSLLALAYFSNILARTTYGCAGKHINFCTYDEIGIFIQLGGINQITFFASVTLIKISMCLFNRRLVGISSRSWKIANNVFLGLLIVWFFITLFINVFQCTPVRASFNFAIQVHTSSYHCLDTGKISNAFSIINCLTDFILLSIPVYIICKVQMDARRKYRLIGVFCIGAACCVCSAYRSSLGNRHSRDLTWIFVPEVSWTIADTFFSAFVASLPALNALVETSWRKTMSIGTGKSKPYATRSGSGHSRPGAPRRLDSEAGHERLGSQSKVSGLAQKSNDSQFSRIDGEEQGRDSVGDGPMNKGSDLRYTMRAKDVELV